MMRLHKNNFRPVKSLAICCLLGIFLICSCKTTPPGSNIPNATLSETYWKLTELMGEPVPLPDANKKEVHIILKSSNRLQGFSGCNSIMGTYEVKNEFSISFSGVATTLMACLDMKTEDTLKKVLEQVDNYSIKGNNLSLNKARMAPLARFEAVYLK